MRHHICKFRLLLLTTTVFLSSLALADNPFTGQFVTSGSSTHLVYASLTQAESNVSGVIIVVTSDSRGEIEQSTLSVSGIVDQMSITLKHKRIIGEYVVSGRREGNSLVLFFPGKDGDMAPVTLSNATEAEYALRLSEFRHTQSEVRSAYAAGQRVQTESRNERDEIQRYAMRLTESLNEIERTRIPDDLARMVEALSQRRSGLPTLQNLKVRYDRIASAYDARRCEYVYSEIQPFFYSEIREFYYSDLHFAAVDFESSLESIDLRLENSVQAILTARSDVSHLNETIANRLYLTYELPTLPANHRQIIDEYEALAANASQNVKELEAEYALNAKEVRDIMIESEEMLENLQARCRYE